MILSKKITSTLLTAIIAFLIAFAPFNTVSANSIPVGDEVVISVDGVTKIKIKIIIIIIIKKKGVVEIKDMKLAGNAKGLENNEVLADVSIRDGKFFLMPVRGRHAKSQFIMPAKFKVSPEVSLKLGEKKGLYLKAGKADLRTSKLGNFEIQD